ncbi:MAG: BACON domain-containing protein, partial [Bryobacteraceae bacterium]
MKKTKVSAWVLALGMCAAPVSGQVIDTVAGTTWFFPASSAPALSAPLAPLKGLAFDAQGNVYASDSENNIVVRISPGGVLTVVAGNGNFGFSGDGGPATTASLASPYGLAVDSAGALYIADSSNNRIRKVSGGTITTFAGGGTGGDGGPATSAFLALPLGVAVDSAGNLYIADWGDSRIRKVSGGTITTFAGGGNQGLGDGGPATSASLSLPAGVAVDSAGNVYIADSYNNRIRKVSGGTITTVAGNGAYGFSGDGGPATSASLFYPFGVTVDSAGNLFIFDTFNQRIRKVSAGTIATVAGNGLAGYSGDGGPATRASLNLAGGSFNGGVGVDSAGNLYIADTFNQRIRKVSAGTISTVAGNGNGGFAGDGGPAANASLFGPSGVAVDSVGNLYIADASNNRIRKLSGGTIATVAGNGIQGFSGDGGPATSASLYTPSGVAVDSAGDLFIADSGNSRIRKVSGQTITTVAGNGNCCFSGDGGPATSASLSDPSAVAVDAAGNLYIADTTNYRIRKVSGGIIATVAGNGTFGFSGDGGPATAAELNWPAGVAVDSAGDLYIADEFNNRIRKVSGGTITTVAGNGICCFSGDGGPATSASLSDPQGVGVDSAGDLYIADSVNWRVRKVSGGTIATVAGNGIQGFSGDGGPATGASLNLPVAVVLDSAGNLYIADNGNNRIREVLAGAVSYQAAPASLSFSGLAGGNAPGAQTINLSPAIAGLSFTASASAAWLSVNPSSGAMPAVLSVSVNPASLSEGTYRGTITIAAAYGTPAVTTATVTLMLGIGAPAPLLGVDRQSIGFAATQGGAALTQQLQVLNTGGGSFSFTASVSTASGGSWLGISAANGTATPSAPAALTVTATPGSLAPGTYSGTIEITGAGNTINVPVTLSVSAPTAMILISQTGLSFTAVAQGGAPLAQGFSILNTGQ